MVIAGSIGPSVWSLVHELISDKGPIPFSQFQELALYHPYGGFYSSGGSAGRSRDFVTSAEVGTLFAHVLSAAIDKWWRGLNKPNPFYIFEVGAGAGTLAKSILGNEMQCARSLRYVAVETSAALRTEFESLINVDALDLVLSKSPVDQKAPMAGITSSLPSGKFSGVVLSNELLDNMPFDIYERRPGEWNRVLIDNADDGGFQEVFEPMDSPDDKKELGYVRALLPKAQVGARIPVQRAACDWLQGALDILDEGKVVAFDYMHDTKWMADNDYSDWCRTYRNQRPGTSPLENPGTQDITCEVAVDQLSRVKEPDRNRSQAEFLDDFGLADIVGDARQIWHDEAGAGGLRAMKARAKVQEGRELTHPDGLGRYRVLEWNVSQKQSEPEGPDTSN